MKLLATPNSPYCRMVRICALELNVDLEVVFVGVRDHGDEILGFSPAGKVPLLITDEGHALSDSRMICEVLQTYSRKTFLAPLGDWERRVQEGLSTGFLDGIAVWVREERRKAGERSQTVTNLECKRAERCLEYFDSNWKFDPKKLDFTAATLVSAFELMETRVVPELIERFSKLFQWYDAIGKLGSLNKTRPEKL